MHLRTFAFSQQGELAPLHRGHKDEPLRLCILGRTLSSRYSCTANGRDFPCARPADCGFRSSRRLACVSGKDNLEPATAFG